jgi:hypothetical protein
MFRLTCQHASRLLSARMDAPLSWTKRVRLRLHLVACDACTSVARQFEAVRLALRDWGKSD